MPQKILLVFAAIAVLVFVVIAFLSKKQSSEPSSSTPTPAPFTTTTTIGGRPPQPFAQDVVNETAPDPADAAEGGNFIITQPEIAQPAGAP